MNEFRQDGQNNPNIQSWQDHSTAPQAQNSQNYSRPSDTGSLPHSGYNYNQPYSGANDTNSQRLSGNANYQNNQSYSGNPYYTGNQQYSGNQQPNPYYSYYSEKKQPEVDELKTSSFYSERYEKPHKGKMREMIVPLLIVALLSSVLGGALVGAWFQFGAPNVSGTTQAGQNSSGLMGDPVKQIEIIDKTDSPVTAIAEKVSPSIVGIQVNYRMQDWWFGVQDTSGSGSGIIIRSDGYILTNNHVIESAMETGSKIAQGASIKVILPNQMDETYEATVIGRDEKTDLAIIKIDLTELPAAELGNSDELKVGELAVAIGNPGGLEFMGSVTSGIVSGLNRVVQISENKELKVIQTDAAINPGNSGGALVNSRGEVIGVNTIKISATGYEGLGFAIPVNTAKEIADSLIADGYVKGRPQLGVSIDPRYTEDIANKNNAPMGLLVAEVVPISGAYNAGVKTGDIITEINGVSIKSFNELEAEKNKFKAGDTIEIKIYRITSMEPVKGEYLTLKVTLGEDKG
ncbi:MAG: trypsin-like peptidase domain-containing protein [Thermoclostridium sp.]|nr:trypsin-like peptidase domain-containing protein [Thermoclostridium sp.]